jgi:hypothetical protein
MSPESFRSASRRELDPQTKRVCHRSAAEPAGPTSELLASRTLLAVRGHSGQFGPRAENRELDQILLRVNLSNCNGEGRAPTPTCVVLFDQQNRDLPSHGTVFGECHRVPGVRNAGMSAGITLCSQYLRNAHFAIPWRGRWHRWPSDCATLCHFTTQSQSPANPVG